MVPFSGKNDGYFIQLPPSIRRALYRDYMHFGKSAKNFAFALIVSQHTFISKDEKKSGAMADATAPLFFTQLQSQADIGIGNATSDWCTAKTISMSSRMKNSDCN
jgi:hypothetical protein